MTVTWTYVNFKVIAPSFAAVSESDFNAFSVWADEQIPELLTVTQRTMAGMLLTAHLMALSPPAGAVLGDACQAPVTTDIVGGYYGIEQHRALKPFAATELSLTTYGIRYDRILSCAFIGGLLGYL